MIHVSKYYDMYIYMYLYTPNGDFIDNIEKVFEVTIQTLNWTQMATLNRS